MIEEEHGVPGPSLGVLRAAGANLMAHYLAEHPGLGRIVRAAAQLEQYYLTAQVLGAPREEAEAALCGTTAPTEEDLDAALRRFKDGTPPMSSALRETVMHLVRTSPASFADIAGAIELLTRRTSINPAFTPWTDQQVVDGLPGLVNMAAKGPVSVTTVAYMAIQVSA